MTRRPARGDARRPVAPTGLEKYSAAARASSATVIGIYSTSFGLAARLLAPGVREQVRTIYALVRIADEIVDGAAAGAGVGTEGQRELLDDLERETARTLERGYSTNLVVHAFAQTARNAGIDARLTAPFFESMRRDLDPSPFTAAGVAEYIYGSAEVIGLMCLACFLAQDPPPPARRLELELGARHLGAAFQKINFLRDLATDRETLGRNYFPGIEPLLMTDADKDRIIDDIDLDLREAAQVLPMLPVGSRRAVAAAQGLFGRLTEQLRATPAAELLQTRVRVSNPQKLLIAVSAAVSNGATANQRTAGWRR
ncbi:phytoene/squalene synthase family protein [Cryobacterium melibiosiphilum]|uniref:phytoene/squalene synthase family protein n=1 Tax=Cryobacterium melibiosiphilum TaxID=995039 RepID=UPI0013143811|nr:squalene/phytoene synthase family protein [Cryobacterium melibiosiphilum]